MPDAADEGHFCRTVHAQLACSRADCGYCGAYVDSDRDSDSDSSSESDSASSGS